jgi:hypothetical protein
VALPPLFIQWQVEFGGCDPASSEQRAKAQSRRIAERLGTVAVKIGWRMRLVSTNRFVNVAAPYCNRAAILAEQHAPASAT